MARRQLAPRAGGQSKTCRCGAPGGRGDRLTAQLPPQGAAVVDSSATWRKGQTGEMARPPLLCRARRRACGPCQQAVFQSRRVRSARLAGPSSAAARRQMPNPLHAIHEPPVPPCPCVLSRDDATEPSRPVEYARAFLTVRWSLFADRYPRVPSIQTRSVSRTLGNQRTRRRKKKL